TIVAVDAGGEPTGPLSLYNDRAEPGDVAAVAGVMPADSAAGGVTSPLARALGLRRTGAAHILHEADWIAGRLGAGFAVTDANNALKTGYDPRLTAWPDWIGAILPVATLPHVVEPGNALGLIGSAAAALGLPPDAIIVAGTTDGCASFLATGAQHTGDGVTALGSTLTLKLLSDVPIFAPEMGIYSHRLLGRWLAGGASNTGGAALACFFAPEVLAALSARIDPLRPTGLDYYPLPGRGERFPVNDPALLSRAEPRPGDDVAFLHGLLEGIAAVEALGYRRLRELGGPALRRVLTVGGGAGNAAWTVLRKRALGVAVETVPGREAAFGTALLARAALR
ncbi:MAG: FGGY-family carbohydrate kinase, partial [Pseudomonadota bacterium]|nr:FGGY-family carbohydrate kinase [Pseudomonadota bacterium]